MLTAEKLSFEHDAASDYEIVQRAIAYTTENFRTQPQVDAIAQAAGTDARRLNELFRRWCGLSPNVFLQSVTLDNARKILRESPNILDASYELGLSGPGRLHDLFVAHESMSPGEWKTGGEGLTVYYGFHPSPFGSALIMATERGLCGLAFADSGGERAALDDMRSRWPKARYQEDSARTVVYAQRIFDSGQWKADTPLRVVLIGTDFEIRVWETLLKIPLGRATTYADIARKIERPKASRAVGAAVG
jgi:AraC family transcriptional regulator of adaptative response/methylated-DNA-[protein]-cysteine methyltransferase